MKKQSLYALVVTLGFIFLPAVASAQSGFYGQHYAPQQSCYKFSQTVRIGGVIHRQYGTRCEPVVGYAPVFQQHYPQQFYQSPRFVRQHHNYGYRDNRLSGHAFPPIINVQLGGRPHHNRGYRNEYCPTRRGYGGGHGQGYYR